MPYVQVLLPTIVVALIFWFVMRAVLGADRSEREAEAKVAQEYDDRVAARAQELRGTLGSGEPTKADETAQKSAPQNSQES
ncbi:hypothetical protein [Galactobacter caseinivorans]|nr:hypothetical protein [Galactobacter caseinivorans]